MRGRKWYIGLAVVFLLMTGCGNNGNADNTGDTIKQEEYNMEAELAELEKQEQALYDEMNAIESLSQPDMNLTSEAAYKLWDDELNAVWSLLQEKLSGTDFESLKKNQQEWIKERDAELDKLREEEWGSAGPTIVNGRATELTKERIYELVTYLE